MLKNSLVAIVALVIGLSAGGVGVGLWFSNRPKEKREVEVVREVPVDPAIVSRVPDLDAPRDVPSREPETPTRKVWVPVPGEVCSLVMRKDMAMAGQDGITQYMIPLDVLALNRLMKYARARDVSGYVDLLHEKRAVWTSLDMIEVSVIAVDDRLETAEVRVRASVYKAKYPYGRTNKEDCQMTSNVEAVVPLAWLEAKK